jgi:hypothetical protein
VTCTGYNNAGQLTGCTWPAGSTLNDDDAVYTGATTTFGTPLLNGFIKIERQAAPVAGNPGVWTDVTLEILNLGFAGPNLQGGQCVDPTPDAVIRIMRLRDNGSAACNYQPAGGSQIATDYWPNMIFDAREGNTRQVAAGADMNQGGIFSYVALDVANFTRWVNGAIGATGNQAWNNNGYIIYFSDRRGDHNEAIVGDPETGEYGNEDSINPLAVAWAKDNVLNAGEDFNENNTLETYGETPHALAIPAGAQPANMGFDLTTRPWSTVRLKHSGRGRLARPVLFRRALKVINGGMVGAVNPLPVSGIAITSENPVFVQGNFNATTASVTAEPNYAASIIADTVTLLSNAFRDSSTFTFPNNEQQRIGTETSYRFAMVTGKALMFPRPAAWAGINNEYGSDGGVHNFMRMLEDFNNVPLRYRGSMVSLFYSRQSIGIYRTTNIYSPPSRGYNFDVDFLTPALLPPGTPMFRDVNTLKFRQILRPNQ